MPFNPSPQSWLTNYTFSSDTISFDLASNYTSSMADPVKFMFRITDDILAKYLAKASADRPYHWESSASYIQPVLTSPNTLQNVTNTFVLDATLFSDLLTPSIPVTVVAQDLVYTGYAYAAFSYTAPSGSVITIEYSSDGGLTWLSNAPTARGSYYIRVTAVKDGRTGSATDSFAITKNTPEVSAPSDVNQVYSAGTTTLAFTAPAGVQFTSISSSNPAAVSVVSFTQSGSVTLQRNAPGEAVITGSTGETSDYFAIEASLTFTLTKIPAVITAPATLALNASGGLSQTFAFTTNFTMTTARWNLITFESSNTSIATITKGASYPATINILQAGSFTLTIAFPGDSEYGDTSEGISVAITGIQPSMRPTITFPGQSAIVTGEPLNTNWVPGKQAQILAALDADSDGEGDGEITLPFSFTININQPTSGTGSSGALTYSFNNFFSGNISWITFTQGANSVGVTINSLPGTTNGEVNGGSLAISKEPSAGVLGWTGTFDINFYKAGPRLALMQSGFYGAAGSTFTEVTQSTVVLNAAGEYSSDWIVSEECCPHIAYLKVLGLDGAPTTGNVNLALNGATYNEEPATFEYGVISKTVALNTQVGIYFEYGGLTTLSLSIAGTSVYNKNITLDIRKIPSSLSVSDKPNNSLNPNCGISTEDQTAYTFTDANPGYVIDTTPPNIGWDGLTTSRIATSFSNARMSVTGKAQGNGGSTLLNTVPNEDDLGESLFTAALAATTKFDSFTITKSFRAAKPLLTIGANTMNFIGGTLNAPHSRVHTPVVYPPCAPPPPAGNPAATGFNPYNPHNHAPMYFKQGGTNWWDVTEWSIPVLVTSTVYNGIVWELSDYSPSTSTPHNQLGNSGYDIFINDASTYTGTYVNPVWANGRYSKGRLVLMSSRMNRGLAVSIESKRVADPAHPSYPQTPYQDSSLTNGYAFANRDPNFLALTDGTVVQSWNWQTRSDYYGSSYLDTTFYGYNSAKGFGAGLTQVPHNPADSPFPDYSIWTSPDLPFLSGYVGDYFELPTSPQVSLTYGAGAADDFTGGQWLGGDYFTYNPTMSFVRLYNNQYTYPTTSLPSNRVPMDGIVTHSQFP